MIVKGCHCEPDVAKMEQDIAALRAKLEQAEKRYEDEREDCGMFQRQVSVLEARVRRLEELIAKVLKDYNDDERGYCCIRDETLRELRALNPPSQEPGA